MISVTSFNGVLNVPGISDRLLGMYTLNEFRTSRVKTCSVSRLGQAVKAGKQTDVGSIPVRHDLALSSKAVVYGYCLNCYFVPPRGE